MADIAIWGGSSTFATGSTPFGFYDTDSEFQTDADKVSKFCASRLGFPLMDVEADRMIHLNNLKYSHSLLSNVEYQKVEDCE